MDVCPIVDSEWMLGLGERGAGQDGQGEGESKSCHGCPIVAFFL